LQDTFHPGGLEISNVTFGEAAIYQETYSESAPFNGYLGLAPRLTDDSGLPSNHDSLRGALDEQIFSFHFMNTSDGTQFKHASLTLGSSNASHYAGELARLRNTKGTTRWEVDVDALGHGHDSLLLKNTTAVFNTAFGELALPEDIAACM